MRVPSESQDEAHQIDLPSVSSETSLSRSPSPSPPPDDVSDVEDNLDEPSEERETASSFSWRRPIIVLIIAIVASLYLVSPTKEKKSNIIYANRYSKEHKYRPAASPIITEILKDGRTRLRGADPTTSAEKPKPTPIRKKKVRVGKTGAKRKGRKKPFA